MQYPVAMIPYANTGPYKAAGVPARCVFVDMVPRESVNALIKAKVWAAAVPVGGLARLKDQIDFLGNFGIATNASHEFTHASDNGFQSNDAANRDSDGSQGQ